jgi:AmmeMemoRadiSam system protein B
MKKYLIFLICLALIAAFFVLRKKPVLITNRTAIGYHKSAPYPEGYYQEVYQAAKSKSIEPTSGFFVNHHLLAASLIAQMFGMFGTDEAKTIVLVSPNHFTAGHGLAITSAYDWYTPFGDLQSDQELVSKLQSSGLVSIDETPFAKEHGIFNLTGFVKKSFPNAKFVPIILKEQMDDKTADELAAYLNNILPQDALVIGSLDFSHYLPSNAADFNDTRTLATIYNQDLDTVKNLDIDSHSGLRMLLEYFALRDTPKFNLVAHSNSSELVQNYKFLETTSYINGYFTKGNNDYDPNQTMLYTGAVDLSRYSRDQQNPRSQAYALGKIERLTTYNLTSNPQVGIAVDIQSARFLIDQGKKVVFVKSVTASSMTYKNSLIVHTGKNNYWGVVINPAYTRLYQLPAGDNSGHWQLLLELEPDKLITEIKL